jgi:hypothetical protein
MRYCALAGLRGQIDRPTLGYAGPAAIRDGTIDECPADERRSGHVQRRNAYHCLLAHHMSLLAAR